jgi:valine--pyruvate aminotransferase
MRLSRYAERFSADSATVGLMQDLGTARQRKGPVYMLGGGNPAHIPAVAQAFQEAWLSLGHDPEGLGFVLGEYDQPQGNAEFIEALAALLKRQFGWALSSDNIAITNGSQASFGMLFNSLAGEFEDGRWRKILLPLTPEYVGYSDVGIHPHPLFEALPPTIEKHPNGFFKYRVDFDRLDIDDRYGAVCVSRPTNPTGNVITDKELRELAKRCRAAGVPLIIDGAYGLPFPNMVFRDALPLWDSNIILCLSLSKLGLPGVRTGIIVADKPIIELVKRANAINNLAPGSVGPALVTDMLRDGSLMTLCNQTIRPYYHQRVQHAVGLAKTLMADLPLWIHEPEGALFMWLWFEDLPVTSAALYQRLVKEGVYIIAGEHFFPGLNIDWPHKYECIRVNYAAPEQTVETGLGIIARVVRDIYTEVLRLRV